MSTLKKLLNLLQLKGSAHILCYQEVAQRTHDSLYNWVIDTETSLANIVDLLNALGKIKEFSEHRDVRQMVAITCLEGLALREPKVLEGDWEELFKLIIFHFDFMGFKGMVRYENKGIVTLQHIKDMIPKYFSPKLCPNPCLRLEIFSAMSDYLIEDDIVTKEAFVSTFYQLQDVYSSFEIKDIIKISAYELGKLMHKYSLEIGSILNSDYTQAKKMAIIKTVVKINKMLVDVEYTRLSQCPDKPGNIDVNTVYRYLHFCGLIQNFDYDLNSFAEVVINDADLPRYVVDTLNSIMDNISFIEAAYRHKVATKISQIVSSLVSAESNLLPQRLQQMPQNLLSRELNGVTPQILHQMLFITNNKITDYSPRMFLFDGLSDIEWSSD